MSKFLIVGLLIVFCAFHVAVQAQVYRILASPTPESDGAFGMEVAGLGDIDNDGFGDIAVGAQWEDAAGSPEHAGQVHIFNGFTGEILCSLISPNEQQVGLFGSDVAGGRDINNDGCPDIIIGACNENPDHSPGNAGRVYVLNGSNFDVIYILQSPNEEGQGIFGSAVAMAGDVNNDGWDDIVAGAKYEDPDSSPYNAGRAYVFSGETGKVLHTLVSPHELNEGFFGHDVACLGDVNGDFCDDVLVGAYAEWAGLEESGRAYVFSGATGGVIHEFVSPEIQFCGQFGQSVAGIGDIDDDGINDIAIGAPHESVGSGLEKAGKVHLFSGQTGAHIRTLVSPNAQYHGYFGQSVSQAKDVNNDGYSDILVGAYGEDLTADNSGGAYIFCGITGELLFTFKSPYSIQGGWFGLSLSGIGDVNGTGRPDVVIGACYEDPGAGSGPSGSAYIYTTMPTVFNLSGYVDDGSFTLSWDAAYGDIAGYWIYGASDLPYFRAGMAPDYAFIIDVLPANILTWSSPVGVGNSEENRTYQVIAVDIAYQNPLSISDRVSEFDFETEIP